MTENRVVSKIIKSVIGLADGEWTEKDHWNWQLKKEEATPRRKPREEHFLREVKEEKPSMESKYEGYRGKDVV